jgi:hypothetical protein
MGAGYPPPPPSGSKKSTTSTLVIVIAVVAFCCLGAVGAMFFVGKKVLEVGTSSMQCFANAEVAHTAMLAYAEENGSLPPAENWQDEIRPYYEAAKEEFEADIPDEDGPEFAKDMFRAKPPGVPLSCEFGDDSTAFSYNSEVAGLALEDIEDPAATVLLFEQSTMEYNFASPYSEFDEPQPTFFNDERDWILIFVEEDGDFFESSRSVTID